MDHVGRHQRGDRQAQLMDGVPELRFHLRQHLPELLLGQFAGEEQDMLSHCQILQSLAFGGRMPRYETISGVSYEPNKEVLSRCGGSIGESWGRF